MSSAAAAARSSVASVFEEGEKGGRFTHIILEQVIERVVAALLHDAVELVRVDLAVAIAVGLVDHVLHAQGTKKCPGNKGSEEPREKRGAREGKKRWRERREGGKEEREGKRGPHLELLLGHVLAELLGHALEVLEGDLASGVVVELVHVRARKGLERGSG